MAQLSDEKLSDSGVDPGAAELSPPAAYVPKDGGWRAWSTLIGGCATFAATMGYANAFGVYQDRYTRAGISASGASWIGSTQLFLLIAMGLPAGKLIDMGYFRITMLTGSVIYVCSLLALSFAKQDQYYQLFLAQGLGMGIGGGLLYVPAMGVQAYHWRKRRPMAVGVVLVGASIGGIIFPIVLNRMLATSSFPFAVRASMFIVIGLLGAANALMSSPNPTAVRKGDLPMKAIMQDISYWFLTLGTLAVLSGVFFPYFYLQLYSILQGVNSDTAFYCLAVMNAASIPGRIGPNLLVNKLGVFNILIPFCTLCGVLVFALFGVSNAGGMFAFAAVYGFVSGAFLSLISFAMASSARHESEIGVRLGVAYSIAALGALVGNPIDGALLGQGFTWVRPIVFTSIMILGGTFFIGVARHLISRTKGTVYV